MNLRLTEYSSMEGYTMKHLKLRTPAAVAVAVIYLTFAVTLSLIGFTPGLVHANVADGQKNSHPVNQSTQTEKSSESRESQEHKGHDHKAHDTCGHDHGSDDHKDVDPKDHRSKEPAAKGNDHKDHGHEEHGQCAHDHGKSAPKADKHEGHDHAGAACELDDHKVGVKPSAAIKAGVEIHSAGPAKIKSVLELPGQIALNADEVCHVSPHVSGTIAEARKRLGDQVRKGEVLAVIDSRELAQAKSRYLVFLKREELAQTDFERMENLWQKKVSPEKEYLNSKQAMEEARIERMAAAQKLFALGLSKTDLKALTDKPDVAMMRYELRAPFDGVVITKHMSKGEWIPENKEILCIADLSEVWVDIIVYPGDLDSVRIGQRAVVKSNANGLQASGVISYVGPLVGEETRTARARVVLPNPDGRWRPGLFVTVQLVKTDKSAPVAVRNGAIQRHEDRPVVFVQKGDHFEVRELSLGLRDKAHTEVLKGISAGEKYAVANSFILKAELLKDGAACGHSH